MTKLHSSPSPPLIWFGWLAAWLVLLLTANTGWMLPPMAEARAILGVDLGSLYMKVALVQSGSPLEIVTNLHSKRKTEQMILFDREQRFYGADASSLLARKAHQTPAAMTVLLGRDDRHPIVEVLAERHYPITPVYNQTRNGVVLQVDGISFTPEELVAMVLQHAVDIAVAHATEQGSALAIPPQDVVLTVPSYATQRERQALLDAAALVHLNVLLLVDENTAAAVQYAMDKTFADAEGTASADQLFVFYNMGGSALQVSLVHFYSYEQPQKFGKPKRVPALKVLAKAWDETLGGEAFDHVIVEHLADEFNAIWRKKRGDDTLDVRKHQRAMTKLRLQANKVKHVLSANTDIPVHMEGVHDELPLSTQITRAQLETLAAPLLARATRPVHEVLHRANKTMADVTGFELIGGGMRIPRVQQDLSELLSETGLELGLHMNADESMALGAAFCGANISTAFRVRHVGLTDVTPFGIKITLQDLDVTKATSEEDVWKKETVLFKHLTRLGTKKTIAFSHDRDVSCLLDYEDNSLESMLPRGTDPALVRYKITGVEKFAKEMEEKGLGKPKVSLQFELDGSGISGLIRAEAIVEETYIEQVEVEVDDDDKSSEGSEKVNETDVESNTEASKEKSENATSGETTNNETKEEGKEPEVKAKKKVLVDKEKKRTHKRSLLVETTHAGRVQPHTPALLAESREKLLKMAEMDKERMMLEESRNKVESYIYRIKNTLSDKEEEIAQVATEEQREECLNLANAAQEWMEDEGYEADYATMEDKYASLSGPFEKIMFRLTEKDARPAAVKDLRKQLDGVIELMKKWETTKPQVTEEERKEVLEKVETVLKWIEEMENKQSSKSLYEEPAFLSSHVPTQVKPVQTLVEKLAKKPKPKPPKTETKNTTAESDPKEASNATDDKHDSTGDDQAATEDTADKEQPNNDAPVDETINETKESDEL